MCFYHEDKKHGIDCPTTFRVYLVPCVVLFFLIMTFVGGFLFIGPWDGCNEDKAQCTVLKANQELNQCMVKINFRDTTFVKTSSFCHKFVCPQQNTTFDCYLNSDYCINLDCPGYRNLLTGVAIMVFGVCMAGCLCFVGCHLLDNRHRGPLKYRGIRRKGNPAIDLESFSLRKSGNLSDFDDI